MFNKLKIVALIAGVAIAAITSFVESATAGQNLSCKKDYYYDVITFSCKKKVWVDIERRDQINKGGPQWGPVNAQNCAAASREMDRMAAKCRRLDAQKAVSDALLGKKVDGKRLQDCAFCCLNLREGMNRWILCNKAGYAPPPDIGTANRSAERMNCGFRY